MSRIDDYEPDSTEDFLRSCAFSHNVTQAVAGKKGRKFLLELEAALLALPVKRLAVGVMALPEDREPRRASGGPGDVCALGAVAAARAVAAGESRPAVVQRLAVEFSRDYEEAGWKNIGKAAEHLKICHPLAYAVVAENDEGRAGTPEERYEQVLAWVRARLKGEREW